MTHSKTHTSMKQASLSQRMSERYGNVSTILLFTIAHEKVLSHIVSWKKVLSRKLVLVYQLRIWHHNTLYNHNNAIIVINGTYSILFYPILSYSKIIQPTYSILSYPIPIPFLPVRTSSLAASAAPWPSPSPASAPMSRTWPPALFEKRMSSWLGDGARKHGKTWENIGKSGGFCWFDGKIHVRSM